MAKPKFKILSIDGGGIKGIIPCKILEFLESQLGELSSVFDLVAGTSTGGIITLGLAKPTYSGDNAFFVEDILNLYVENGSDIFKKRLSFLDNILSINKNTEQLFKKAYQSDGLESLLIKKFDGCRLADSLTDVLITTYDLKNGKPFLFSSRQAKKLEKENLLYTDVARSTSAAPSYFMPSLVDWDDSKLQFIDGGVFANNPSILAYCEAKELYKRRGEKAFKADPTSDDNDFPFFMLSIGTGTTKRGYNKDEIEKWRAKDWIEPMLQDIFMRGVSESTHHSMQYLLPSYKDDTPRYIRLNPDIPPENQEMDNVSEENIDQLQELANEYIENNEEQLMRIVELLG